jgi:heme exporter protein B
VRAILALVWKDLVIEARTRELMTAMSLVAFLTVVILSLAVGPSPSAVAGAAPAILWVTVAFAATLGLARSHALERERQAFHALLLTPVDRGTLYLGKCAANLLLVLALQGVVLLTCAVVVNADVGRRAALIAAPFVLGAVGFTAAGTLLGAMTATTRLREVLLPILLLPVTLPVILVSLAGITAVLDGQGPAALSGPLGTLAAFDIVFLILGMWLFEYVVEE